ncbi:MAG: porin [Betaproteobacteria bacterium]|nr:porin [Betaproteobacteria bacterium]
MQKKIIALALAGLASSAAFAQSNVTLYGRADYGYMVRGDDDGAVSRDLKNKSEFASGIGAGSRIGFKGSEDLGNGLKAIFEIEYGLSMDASGSPTGSSNTTWWNRHSYVGLSSATLGTVVGGRLDGVRYGIFNKYDAFAGGNIGNFTQMTSQVDRANNAVAYISPSFSGFNAVLAYSSNIGNSNDLGLAAQEGGNSVAPSINGNAGDATLYTANLNYTNGGLSLSADYEYINFYGGNVDSAYTAAKGHDDAQVYLFAGSYDFGVVKVAALYDRFETSTNSWGRAAGLGDADIQSWFISASAPLGKFLVKATYGETENDNAKDSKGTKFGLGLDYNLSKRTKIYTGYAIISNENNAAYQVSPAANSYGTGYGVQGFDLGVAHTF